MMISAMHGTNVGHLYDSIDEAYECATRKLSTNQLTRILEDAVKVHQPPMVRNRRIKLRYCHAGAMNPPTIIIHGNQTEEVPASYKRYLENTFRKVLKIMERRSGLNSAPPKTLTQNARRCTRRVKVVNAR